MTSLAEPPKLSRMDYRVVKTLGTGAGSTILLIIENQLSRKYALKVVKRQGPDDDIYVNQVLHEYKVAQRLNHPTIVRIFDCRTRRSWFRITGVELLMEYVDGKVLEDLQGAEIGQLVLIFSKVAEALIHMHRRGIYHGDLKPSNILLSRSGEVKVIDFGTAWIKGEDKGRVQGTPHYMAPEQASKKIVDERTDIYNFGATMYRMFTGEYANLGIPSLDSGKFSQVRPKPPIHLVEDIPGTLNETILACLEGNPDRRPAGMFEVQHQLDAVAKYLGLEGDEPKGSEED
ncbi:hypothetical protein BH23PLA1_BH23PLA1_11930 [soil metagenome]